MAVFTKLVGCGVPSLIFLKDRSKSMKVGIGMISRGEVGLIVAGIGVTSGVLSTDIYTSVDYNGGNNYYCDSNLA